MNKRQYNVTELNKIIYKANIGDFPLKDYPCKYWWVRYAVACTFLSKKYEELWGPTIEELKREHGFSHFSYRGRFKFRGIRTEEGIKAFLNAKIFLWKDKKEIELDPTSEIFRILSIYIRESPEYTECPYQDDKQSVCPFYEAIEFYKDTPLEELRERKGYNL